MSYQQLTSEERYAIAAMRAQKLSVQQIAGVLRRHRSTIYREIERNCSRYDGAYRPMFAVEKTRARRRRSRRNQHYGRRDFVPIARLLRKDWSPAQIVGRRRREGHVVTDKANGGTLWRHLRGARKQRRKRYGHYDSRGRLAGKRSIQQRPTVVARRARLGDWEIDTVHGRGKACVVTTVERKSGLVRIGKLPRATIDHTNTRTLELLRHEPHPVRTVTADNGAEFHGYRALETALDTTFYFATPHHAWERGTNENTNGLLRQYLPSPTPTPHVSSSRTETSLEFRTCQRASKRTPRSISNSRLDLRQKELL